MESEAAVSHFQFSKAIYGLLLKPRNVLQRLLRAILRLTKDHRANCRASTTRSIATHKRMRWVLQIWKSLN